MLPEAPLAIKRALKKNLPLHWLDEYGDQYPDAYHRILSFEAQCKRAWSEALNVFTALLTTPLSNI